MRKILAAIMLMTTFTVWAGDYEDGMAAFERKDYTTAVEKFTTAAKQGDAFAQTFLGTMYNTGEGVAQDYAQAVRWYKLAADQGDAFAQILLGLMYADGNGIAQDYEQAVFWYRASAEKGDRLALLLLGFVYDKGQGVPQNYIQAHVWFNLAAAQGYKLAVEGRDRVAKQMTPQQITQAQKLATECLARNYKDCD